MADKQIIIDGVDIKNCKRRIGKDNFCRYYKRPCAENNYNCIWKKYLRKEQECEELKKEIAFGNNGTLSDKIRAEVFKELNNESKQLSKTLTEIKEIAEKAAKCLYATKSDDYTDGYRWLGSIILQKISEYEVGNEN